MKLKYKILIVVSVILGVLINILIGFVYYRVSMRDVQENQEYFCESILETLQHDEAFESQYGYVCTVALDFEKNEARKEADKHKIACFAETVEGIRYALWVSYHRDTNSYTILYDTVTRIS